jgi:hypothetical protein
VSLFQPCIHISSARLAWLHAYMPPPALLPITHPSYITSSLHHVISWLRRRPLLRLAHQSNQSWKQKNTQRTQKNTENRTQTHTQQLLNQNITHFEGSDVEILLSKQVPSKKATTIVNPILWDMFRQAKTTIHSKINIIMDWPKRISLRERSCSEAADVASASQEGDEDVIRVS